MSDSIDLETAAMNAKLARQRLAGTAAELQDRLAPAKLLDNAVTGVKDGAGAIALNSVDAARRRPAVAAGIAAGAALLILRKPILRLFGRNKETS
jgi:hypothetical protein